MQKSKLSIQEQEKEGKSPHLTPISIQKLLELKFLENYSLYKGGGHLEKVEYKPFFLNDLGVFGESPYNQEASFPIVVIWNV
jgi:hypothetical protein